MQVKPVNVWIPREVLRAMTSEAVLHYPNESGGVLVGYYGEDSSKCVVIEASGPGPNARHGRFTFEPDANFQEDYVRAAYLQSHRRYSYLGDWHSHPGGTTTLSRRDKRTLKGISRAAEARLKTPLMSILAGEPAQWRFAIWQFKPERSMFTSGRVELATICFE